MKNETNNTKVDTSVENLSRLCKVAAEMRAAGNETGALAVIAAMHRALGIA